ncbi:hypothetical protein ACIBG8_15645 [Nonomuraea sp. NPDC050556]|uniref:lectin-like domain-containing protein n=1 Tax=Nonomuraea sp. NPDC050556 TaxID=3364369 RepID=UPI0037A12CD7
MEYGLHHSPSRAKRSRLAAATAVMAGLTFAATITPAHAEELETETFTGTTAPTSEWLVSSLGSSADHPCLTAAPSNQAGSIDACVGGPTDTPGDGVFRFTSNAQLNGNAGAIMLNHELDASKGLTFEFDMYQYDPKPYNEPILGARGGDGISFYIVDGKAPASVGQYGGWLGYKGLKGAFVGVGFDSYGNFSNPKIFDAGTGGPVGCDVTKSGDNGCVKPNSVVVRGAEATKYSYVSGITLPKTQMLLDPVAKEHNAARQHAVIDISTKGIMNVGIRFKAGADLVNVVKDLDLRNVLPNQPQLPPTIKVGWAAGTGAATAKLAISGFQARTLDADAKLTLTNDGPWKGGETGSYTATVSNSPDYGYIDNPLKMTVDIPAGVTPTAAAGDGWTCAIDGQKVTCDRPAGSIPPGGSAPPVKIDVAIAKDTSGTVTAKGVLDQVTDVVGGIEVNTGDNVATSPADVTAAPAPAPGPDLSTTVGGTKTLEPGNSGAIVMTTVNAPAAGPTDSEVVAVYTVPDPLQITGASGDGWTCTIDGQKVTCKRPGTGEDALPGGESYPPVTIGVKVPDGQGSGPVSVTTDVETAGDTNPANNKGTGEIQLPVVDPAPTGELDVKITSKPAPYVPGKPYTYEVTVTNTGPVDVQGATVGADWPTPWDTVKWTCTSAGGKCPAASGMGDLDEVISLAAGGKMTFKVTCIMPEGVSDTFTASATVQADGTNCAKTCSSSDENSPAPARKQ